MLQLRHHIWQRVLRSSPVIPAQVYGGATDAPSAVTGGVVGTLGKGWFLGVMRIIGIISFARNHDFQENRSAAE